MAYGVDVDVPDLRVILRKPDVIVNTSLIPIQPVAEFALTASHAVTSSYSATSSYALNAEGSGFPFEGDAVITGSLYVISSSGVGLGGVTGSFSGSYVGDGSGLENVAAAVVLEIDGGFANTEFDETDIVFDGGTA